MRDFPNAKTYRIPNYSGDILITIQLGKIKIGLESQGDPNSRMINDDTIRKLADAAKKNQNEIDFLLDASDYNKGGNNWVSGILSKTLIPFYGVSVIAALIVMFVIK